MKKILMTTILCCMVMVISACGQSEDTNSGKASDAAVTDAVAGIFITPDQALEGARRYYYGGDTPTEHEGEEKDLSYWEIAEKTSDMIVVLYRSYTGAQNRYYVDAKTGETYVTEFVPGITDEEQRTGETFNIRDYLSR